MRGRRRGSALPETPCPPSNLCRPLAAAVAGCLSSPQVSARRPIALARIGQCFPAPPRPARLPPPPPNPHRNTGKARRARSRRWPAGTVRHRQNAPPTRKQSKCPPPACAPEKTPADCAVPDRLRWLAISAIGRFRAGSWACPFGKVLGDAGRRKSSLHREAALRRQRAPSRNFTRLSATNALYRLK